MAVVLLVAMGGSQTKQSLPNVDQMADVLVERENIIVIKMRPSSSHVKW
jgi:hypothetical protein